MSTETSLPQFLTVEEVADALRVHTNSVLRYCSDGRLRATKVMGQWRIAVADLEQFINDGVPQHD
jgi:excisionase family DNA binding protein